MPRVDISPHSAMMGGLDGPEVVGDGSVSEGVGLALT